jgi:hypothetical protein
VSDSILDKVDNICIKPGYRSDHSVVELILNLSNQPKGPGLWKFNNSILKDEKYIRHVREIKKVINDVTSQNNPK